MRKRVAEEQVQIRAPAGTRAQLKALRGDKKPAEYERDLLLRAIEAEKRGVLPPVDAWAPNPA